MATCGDFLMATDKSRPRRLKPSPLTHTIPSQRVHPCLDVSPVPGCPGYTFGYTPADHRRDRSPLWNASAVPNHLAVMRWLHIYRSITGLPVWDGAQQHYRICHRCEFVGHNFRDPPRDWVAHVACR
jgi:hypothetical protein